MSIFVKEYPRRYSVTESCNNSKYILSSFDWKGYISVDSEQLKHLLFADDCVSLTHSAPELRTSWNSRVSSEDWTGNESVENEMDAQKVLFSADYSSC